MELKEIRKNGRIIRATSRNMSTTRFEGKLSKINLWTVLVLPKSASMNLSSRGLVLVSGTINGSSFQTALEPDGRGSHWFKLNKELLKSVKADLGDSVKVAIEPIKIWPEPEVPEDLKKALLVNKEAYKTWMEITPIARWDWIRWINSTKNPQTRKIRIGKTSSKFRDGIRRPCCFNRTMCTIPDVSNNGVLLTV